MRDEVRRRCESLIANRDAIQKVFSWGNGILWLAGAEIFTAKEKRVDIDALRRCKKLIDEKTGAFSNFRGSVKCAVTAMLEVSGNPEGTLENGLSVHKLLKKQMWDSAFLPMAAMVIARLAPAGRYEELVVKTKQIYDKMKTEHPFLTSSEDSALCALMALSEKSTDELVTEAEQCYRLLQKRGFGKNAVQSLSHVLALCDGTPEEKCNKTIALYDELLANGCKYGVSYELPTLGVLAMEHDNYEALADEIKEVDAWLSGQKGFGFWGSITKKQRLMFAGMLLQEPEGQNDLSESAMVQSTVAIVVAQEAATLAAISACTAASVAAANS